MKYLTLIWAGLWRNKIRTTLTTISMIVSFLLFGVLQSFSAGLQGIFENLAVERLFIQNRLAAGEGMPIAHFERIRAVPGVTALTHWTFFGAFYQDPRNSFTMFATDIAGQFATTPKLAIPRDQYETMLRTRDGLIVSQGIAARFGWKVGDRIPLGSSVWLRKGGSNAYEFQVVGIMDISEVGGERTYPVAFMHFDYLDEARSYSNGIVGLYIARIDDARRESEIGSTIDALFANSSAETKSQTEQSWTQAQVTQFGDVQAIAEAIAGAVLFTLLFLTANTMMQSVRERLPELGVMKALGFSNTKILLLIISESLLLCLAAMAVGLVLASAVFKSMAALFGDATLPTSVIFTAVGIAVLLALSSAGVPAMRAARLNVVDTLAGR
jgi:putative ABC transport system permease protein